MSIYGTDFTFQLMDEDDRVIMVHAQVVASFITDEMAFLPPPRLGINENDGYRHPRAVVFVGPWTEKGTERSGQEYVDPLLVLSGEDYERMPFREVMGKLQDAIERAQAQP